MDSEVIFKIKKQRIKKEKFDQIHKLLQIYIGSPIRKNYN
jgi:hypothetical protein